MSADLSVVVPVRDGAATLEAALRSIVGRAEGLAEIVVVDDGSRDGSGALAEAIGGPVRVLRQEGRGAGAARNAGVAAARGSLLGFLDADDEWLAGAPDPRRALLAAEPGAIAFGGVCVQRGEHEQTGPLWVFGAALMRPETFTRVGPIDETLLGGDEDLDWFLRAREAGVDLRHVPDAVVRYVRREGSLAADPDRGLLSGLHRSIRRRAEADA